MCSEYQSGKFNDDDIQKVICGVFGVFLLACFSFCTFHMVSVFQLDEDPVLGHLIEVYLDEDKNNVLVHCLSS